MKIISVVGARPNFIKIAPLINEFNKNPDIQSIFLHTGQHYDYLMSQLFFKELKIPKPHIFLNVGSDSHAKQTAKIMTQFDEVCDKKNPDAIMVAGDVNSTLACSIVAAKRGIKIFHLEAGLRSFDRTMPEEVNRILTDQVADYLLTPSIDANKNLLREGINQSKIYLVGNIMIDSLVKFLPLINKSTILKKLSINPHNYILVTLHRPSNVDSIENFTNILKYLDKISRKIPVIFPIHPRTRKSINNFKLTSYMNNIIAIDPVGYLDFQKLMSNSKAVITDSGGIQEETTFLKIPCITVRENTERPITITEGTNELVGLDISKLSKLIEKVLSDKWKVSKIPGLWDGETSKRVLKIINNYVRH